MTEQKAIEVYSYRKNGTVDVQMMNAIHDIYKIHKAEIKAKDEKIADLIESHEYFVSEKNRTKRFVPPYKIDELKSRTCEGCKYLADNNVCVNSDCPLCCDFVSNDFCCNLWESKYVSK